MAKKRHKKRAKPGLPPGTLVYTGYRDAQQAEVRSLWYKDTEVVLRDHYDPSLRQRPDGTLWIDVNNLTDTALIARIGGDFGIHPLALEDVLDTQQRPKLEEYGQHLFLILPNLRFQADTLELLHEQVAVCIGKNFVISFQEDPDDTFKQVRTRNLDGLGIMRRKGPDYLAYALTDTVVDNYYLVLDDVETAMQGLEVEITESGATMTCKAKIFQFKRIISQLRHRVMPLRDATLRFYRTENPLIEDQNRLYLRDVTDHVAQILDGIETAREVLTNVEALYHAEVANRMNNVMRLLTVISTIFIPLSFVAGIYGMNFDNMPELHWRNGYFIVLGTMLLVMVGMLIYFRRKRWI
jgi:magnesium transporter